MSPALASVMSHISSVLFLCGAAVLLWLMLTEKGVRCSSPALASVIEDNAVMGAMSSAPVVSSFLC